MVKLNIKFSHKKTYGQTYWAILLQKIFKIYHGCFRKNADGTNRIIANDEKCLTPTSRAFWKYIEDIPANVKTSSQYKSKSLWAVELSTSIFEIKTERTGENG